MPTKRKVVETEPEPVYSEQPNSAGNVSLFVSARCDYCKYVLKNDKLLFRDTLMFQTRIVQYECHFIDLLIFMNSIVVFRVHREYLHVIKKALHAVYPMLY